MSGASLGPRSGSAGETLAAGDLIVHHHDAGYYSEKVRKFMGIRGLTWHSVIQPLISPKPTFTRLTGGYQRVPALQIGADVYCDSKLVLLELSRRAFDRSSSTTFDFVVNAWVDKILTPATFGVALPDMGGQMDPEFVRDRAELYGPSFDLEGIAAASLQLHGQWRAQVAWLEEAFAQSGDPFLGGQEPGIADVSSYIPFWFFEVRMAIATTLAEPLVPVGTPLDGAGHPEPGDHAEALLAGLDRVKAWRSRMSDFGHGDRRNASHEDAFAVARDNEPAPPPEHDGSDPLGLDPGSEVTIIADDSERDPVTGILVAATPERLVLAREDDSLGRIHVHFPRFSYFASPARS